MVGVIALEPRLGSVASGALLGGGGMKQTNNLIIGIDPGLTNTGWAMLDRLGPIHFRGAGVVVQDRDLALGWLLEDLFAGFGRCLLNTTRKTLPELRNHHLWVVIEAPPQASRSPWGQKAASEVNLAAGALWGVLRPYADRVLFVSPATWQTALGLPKPPKGLTSHHRRKANTGASRGLLWSLVGGEDRLSHFPLDSPHAVDAALLALYARRLSS